MLGGAALHHGGQLGVQRHLGLALQFENVVLLVLDLGDELRDL